MKAIGPVIPITFLLAAAWMGFDDSTGLPEMEPAAVIEEGALDGGPRRALPQLPLTMKVAGYDQRCSECHALFESSPETQQGLLRHEDIVLDHGLNNRCLNCHSQKDRDKLILHGEKEIGFDQVVELCAKCHGPTWRDWERGMHGRTEGAWDPDSPDHRRLQCTECHDPHQPAFPSISPLPGPNTLRMGEPHHHEPSVDDEGTSPLLRWLQSSAAQGGATQDHGQTEEDEQ